LTLAASTAWGHGFELTLNPGNPSTIGIVSQQPSLDQDGHAPPVGSPMNTNLFLDQFLSSGSDIRGAFQQTDEGGPNIQGGSGAWGVGTTFTFNITSPLYFSNGTPAVPNGPLAVPASGTTNIYFSDADDAHPATSGLHAVVSGTSTTPVAGFQLLDPYGAVVEAGHELVKNIYLDPASTQTDGEYGFSYTVTAHFAGGATLTTGPLVDVFALYDPTGTNGALDAFLGSDALQDAATTAIYNAVDQASVAVPEPSTTLSAVSALGVLCALSLVARSRAGRARDRRVA
jgi:hypothetical protein